ncbi:MAG: GPGG-motif small membrane protein [Nocardioidaceae bacterium]
MTLLLILGIILIIAGVVGLVRGQMLWGIVLVVLGLIIAPGSQLL